MSQDKSTSRRDFIRHTALTGAGGLLTASTPLLARQEQQRRRVASRGYAARDTSGHLSPWDFERRPIGDDDVLIEIKYSGICHSDIHQLRGDWAPQQYPQVPGHESERCLRGSGGVRRGSASSSAESHQASFNTPQTFCSGISGGVPTWRLVTEARADDLDISPFREDGKTYGTPTWIWSVVVDGNLYVRGYNGRTSTQCLRTSAGTSRLA